MKTIRAAGVEGVAVPWMVMEELAAQRALRHREKFDAAYSALQALRQNTPWPLATRLPDYEPERLRQHWRDAYAAVVDVLPLSESALREAAFREANVLPPCKRLEVKGSTKPVKTGSRDATIWLSAVEYAREHPDETVYFVSKNTDDFGDGTSYQPPMSTDLQGVEDRFVHYTSLAEVVSRFTESTDIDEDAIRAQLAGEPATEAIAQEAWAKWKFDIDKRVIPQIVEPATFEVSVRALVSSDGVTVGGGRQRAVGWLQPPTVRFAGVGDVSTYRIGEHVWCTATASWLVGGLVMLSGLRAAMAGCAWETRLLMSPSNREAQLTVLRSQSPTSISAEELATLPEFPSPRLHLAGDEGPATATGWRSQGSVLELLLQSLTAWQYYRNTSPVEDA
ncbi:hypothetical protein FE633_12805 [Streptomyces montanus]|uniref:DUF4935 domain-containing protein n=1 Tax=Streptomyces montanus TaxID=2580423 RepID=A0A5R9FP02_9ACTN|nr:hypothetical protein FE633_12805 [Streptomyces montanus]